MSPPQVLYPDERSYSASGPCGQQIVQSYQNCTTKFCAQTAGNHISDVLVYNFHRDHPHHTHTLSNLSRWLGPSVLDRFTLLKLRRVVFRERACYQIRFPIQSKFTPAVSSSRSRSKNCRSFKRMYDFKYF